MDFIRSFRMAAGVALVGLLVLASGTSLYAQTANASVAGSVKDSQGGILPGATVTLTSRTQGNTLTATTNSAGNFVFTVVRPDTYTLKVTMQGFKVHEQTNLVVGANDKLSAGTLTLEVGALTESVTVSSRISELQATSGERSFTLESEALTNIANNGRSLFGFTTLVPGAVPFVGYEGGVTQVSGFVANGQRPNSNNMTIDGVANIDTGDNGGNMATTNIDAVAEFKVLTNSYQAEYGRAVGAQVQVVTKSGTQSFHGSGYWYGRRSGWNANSWTNKRAEAPAPVGNGKLIEPPEASRNDYGYTIGGPIYIPGVFNEEKTKLFFFWSQEWQKRKDPVSERTSRVPTALERAGDFSQSVDNNGNLYRYIRDYTTGLPCSAADTRGCYQDGGVVGRIPASRLYQPGINALNIYPQSNTTGSNGNNYTSQTPSDTPRREELLRLDFQPSDQWRFTGRYMRDSDTQELPYGTTWAGAGSNNLDTIQTLFVHPGSNWMLSATGILNNSTSLELSVGRAHNSLKYGVDNPDLRRAAAGLSNMPLLYPSAVQEDYIPDMRFNGGRVGGNAGYFQTDRGPFVNENTTWDAIANLTKTWGSHVTKIGAYYQNSYKPQSPFASFNSQISFIDDSSNPYDTGFGYANAATGVFRTYTQASTYALPEWRYQNFEAFLQDNWKATSRLTLDYGVRFYYLTPQWDQTLAASNFLPDKYNPADAARLYYPVCVNGATRCSGSDRRGMDPALVGTTTPTTANTVEGRFIGRVVPGTNPLNGSFQAGKGINDQMQSGNAFRVSPRLGFVFDVTGKGETIVRGGGGIFYDRPQGNMVFDAITNAPGMLQPTVTWGRLQDLSGASTQTDPAPTLGLNPTAYDFNPPKVYAWNVGVQQKLWKAIIFDIAYVGSVSRNLLRQQQINSVPYGAKLLAQNQDPTTGSPLPDDLLRPYQGYNNIRMWGYDGKANYNAFQTSLSRRFDMGLMFNVFYVRSKTMTDSNDDFTAGRFNVSEAERRRADWSYASYDRPNNFVINLVYQTPKLTDNWALGLLTNNWQISGIYRWMSGTPYTLNFSIPNIGAAQLTGSDGNNNARVVVTCDPGKGWSSDPYKQFDTSCFAPPQPGSDGTESPRYFLHGPPINNLDFSLSKAFQLGKVARIEVRLDLFNALNTTQFSGVNSSVSFASLTDATVTNPVYENNEFKRNNGFGSINGVRTPRQVQLVTRITF
jgi:hypothetical protein